MRSSNIFFVISHFLEDLQKWLTPDLHLRFHDTCSMGTSTHKPYLARVLQVKYLSKIEEECLVNSVLDRGWVTVMTQFFSWIMTQIFWWSDHFSWTMTRNWIRLAQNFFIFRVYAIAWRIWFFVGLTPVQFAP